MGIKIMRAFAIGVFLCLLAATASLLALAAPAQANSGACYNISDSDRRALCLAKAQKSPGYCYNIRDMALRSECLAEVKGG